MASEKDATCENDPNFAIIGAFFQKFSTMLNIQPPDIQRLREWLENIDEVPPGLKMLHIKLLRKLRKTVHETAWETALSKFCYTYSSQDAWEIERFGYKKSSLKVKLRILKELVESQFQRNGRFRSIFTSLSADDLRSEPIGRDKLGHAYYLTQDRQCNLRVYQEHLDEEIWQVVASNRDELVNLIARLKGNEVVLPSVVVDEDSSSNSNTAIEKPPPPEEHDSQDEEEEEEKPNEGTEEKIPNIKIKLGAIKSTLEVVDKEEKVVDKKEKEEKNEANENEECNQKEQEKELDAKTEIKVAKEEEEVEKESQNDNPEDKNGEKEEEFVEERIDNNGSDKTVVEEIENKNSGLKTKVIASENVNENERNNGNNNPKDKIKNGETEIIQGNEVKSTKKRPSEDTDKEDQNSHETPAKKFRPTLLDANREKKKSRYEKYHPESDEEEELEEEVTEDDEDTEEVEAEAEDEDGVGEEIVENVIVFKGEGNGKDCESSYVDILFGCENLTEESPVEGEVIEEETFYVYGEGTGENCFVGNSKECTEYENESKSEIKYEVKKISERNEETVLKNSEKLVNCKEITSVDEQNNEEIKNGEKLDSTNVVSKLTCPVSKSENAESCKAAQNEIHSKAEENDEPTDLSFSGKDRKEDKSEVNASDNKSKSNQSNVNCNNSGVNRKRKLSTEENRKQNSESDGDLNSEAEEVEETDEMVGAKRIKMRSKIINSNIRKSVEKRRNEVRKESSSEDENTNNTKKEKLATDLVLDKNEYLSNVKMDNSIKTDIKTDIKSENDGEDTEDEDSIENNAAQSVKYEKEDESVPEFEKEDIKTEDVHESQNGNEESMGEAPVQSKAKAKRQKKRKGKKSKASTNRNNAKPKRKTDKNTETAKDVKKVSEENNKKIQENITNDKESKTESLENSDTKGAEQSKSTKKQRRKLDVDTSNIIDQESDVAPVRQSRRIAQLKIKEEAERRKLEEIALKKMKQDLKKKKKEEKKKTGSSLTIMLPSEPSEKESEIDSELEMKKKLEKKKRGLKKGGWSSGSDDEEEQEEDEIESYAGSPLFRSDHEFSPESDLEDESQIVPLKRARTAKKEGEIDTPDIEENNEACEKCGKTDHPEWILLCDKCDKGYHCSCLSPMLFIIPEGDWLCPPCQQKQLIEALENHLKVYDEMVATKKAEEEKRAQDLKLLQEQAEEEAKAVRLATGGKQPRKKYSNRETPDRQRRRKRYNLGRGKTFGSENSDSDDESRSSSDSRSFSSSSSSSDDNSSSSDDVPIYKLRKRRQTNVSYRLHEYDDLIDSAIKEEMDEVAGAGNLGRGKDISTIIEADKEEKLRLKQLEARKSLSIDGEGIENQVESEQQQTEGEITETKVVDENAKDDDSGSDFNPRKSKMSLFSRKNLKKKGRKLNCLDVSSEEDPSDEDFKTSSYETEDEEDESISVSTDSDSSLEIYRHKNKKEKRSKRATRRAARDRNKRYIDKDFIADSTDDSDIPLILKKKRKEDSEYTASETDEDESEEVDSEELCDDTTESESDGAWRPSKRKKQKKMPLTPSIPKKKGPKKPKGSKKNDDTRAFKAGGYSKKKHFSDEDSMDSSRRTRGKRFTYLEDYEDESSDDGIKPGVKRPDTPPEEREQFIKRQEEIKRMLAEKNSEAAKVVATPIIPLLEKRKQLTQAVEETASLSTVPLSVIKGAKALDIDYLQRKGELGSDGGESEFDDDLPEDFNPEDMDEEEIAKMMEEEDFAQQQLKLAGEAIRQKKLKESENQPLPKPEEQIPRQVKVPLTLPPDPIRKKLPIPTIYPLIAANPQYSKIVNNPSVLNKLPPPPNRVLMHTSQTSQPGPISPPFVPIPPSAPSAQPNPVPPQAIVNKLPLLNCAPPPPPLPPNQPRILPIENRQQTSVEENNASDLSKPRGRRKKITPLRESLQKQPTSTVVTTNTTSAISIILPSTIGSPTVISPASSRESTSPISDKSNLVGVTNLSIAQPPQLYKPQSSPQPSVITRLPQLPPRPRFPDQNARFFSPNQLGHRLPPPRLTGMSLPPHHLIRSYVSGPPPLRSSSAAPPSVSLSSNIIRHQLLGQPPFANSEQFSPRSRHSSPSLNPYRPPLFGSPGYPPVPQGPPPPASHQSQSRSALSLTSGPSAAQIALSNSLVSAANEFPGSNRIIQTPYGPYYPPIGTSHSTPPPPIATAVPSSVIVTAAPSNPSTPVTVPAAAAPAPPPPTAPLPPTNTVLTTANAVTSQPSVSKAAPLETFDAKTTPPLETESARSPYSATSQEGNDDDPPERASNTTSEFSGLVSYFSSQQDDLNT